MMAARVSGNVRTRGPVSRILVALVATFALVLLASRMEQIGERIPATFLAVWFGSALIVALVFLPSPVDDGGEVPDLNRRELWFANMRVVMIAVLPLAVVPIFELRRSGWDPMIWLMEAALVISLCSAPFFAQLTQTVVGTVALTWGGLTLLWLPTAVMLFRWIERAEKAKPSSNVDTANTLHAFFVPEYRYLFYGLSAAVIFVYCPVMMGIGYRKFVATRS